MLHLSRVSSHFPYSSPNTTIVTSLIASRYFVAANHDNVSLIMFKVWFLLTVPCNFPGWWVETREKLLNGLTYLARHLTMRVSTSGIPDTGYGICTVWPNKGDVSGENFFERKLTQAFIKYFWSFCHYLARQATVNSSNSFHVSSNSLLLCAPWSMKFICTLLGAKYLYPSITKF